MTLNEAAAIPAIKWPAKASNVTIDGRTGSVVGYDTDPDRVLVRFSDHGTVSAVWLPLSRFATAGIDPSWIDGRHAVVDWE